MFTGISCQLGWFVLVFFLRRMFCLVWVLYSILEIGMNSKLYANVVYSSSSNVSTSYSAPCLSLAEL